MLLLFRYNETLYIWMLEWEKNSEKNRMMFIESSKIIEITKKSARPLISQSAASLNERN